MGNALANENRVEVQGLTLECYRKGKGQPLLFLHGTKDAALGWQTCHETLSQSFDVIVPIHPGFGHSTRPKDMETVEDLTYFYMDFLKELDLDEVTVVGADLGGWIAAEMVIRSSSRIKALVLVDAVGIKISDRETRDITDTFTMSYEDQIRHLWHDPERGKTITVDPTTMDAEDLEVYCRNQETEVLYTWQPFMYNPHLLKRLYRVEVPTLVLWGESDGVVLPEYGRRFAQEIKGARFVCVAEAGHLPHLEQPEVFAEMVKEFAASGL